MEYKKPIDKNDARLYESSYVKCFIFLINKRDLLKLCLADLCIKYVSVAVMTIYRFRFVLLVGYSISF